MADRPRQCYIVLPDQRDEQGYIPSLVTEGQPGHQPLAGDKSKFQTPWYWGTSWENAQNYCARRNADDFHLTDHEIIAIVASSMGAQFRSDRAR